MKWFMKRVNCSKPGYTSTSDFSILITIIS